MEKKVKEKYLICPSCGETTTWTKVLKEVEFGGSVGMCYCEFLTNYWNEEYNNFDVQTDRIFNNYIEVSKKIYDWLKSEKNNVLRLKMFKTIPKNKRLN